MGISSKVGPVALYGGWLIPQSSKSRNLTVGFAPHHYACQAHWLKKETKKSSSYFLQLQVTRKKTVFCCVTSLSPEGPIERNHTGGVKIQDKFQAAHSWGQVLVFPQVLPLRALYTRLAPWISSYDPSVTLQMSFRWEFYSAHPASSVSPSQGCASMSQVLHECPL